MTGARDATAKSANDGRDEDLDGPVEFESAAQRKCEFAADMGIQAPSEDRSDLGIFDPSMRHMCHMPVVEVGVETGPVTFLDYVAVHDCGTYRRPT